MINWRPEQLLRVTIGELSRQRVLVGFLFMVVSIGSLMLGLVLPKKFSSAGTVLAERSSILTPLMEGRAIDISERFGDQDRLRFYRELLFSREIVERVIDEAGWLDRPTTDQKIREQATIDVVDQTNLEATGPNLIRITVTDGSAERAYATARLFSELLVSESEREKTRESTEAFEFIDRQVSEYHAKLIFAEQRLTEYRAMNVDVGQGTETAITERINNQQNDIERNRLELREARTRARSLQAQLSGQAQVVIQETRISQYRAQIDELQEQIDVLRLRYTDRYPDIVNIRYQIVDVEKALQRELAGPVDSATTPGSAANRERDSRAVVNPFWQRLRQSLSDVTTEIAALEARLAENERLLVVELSRARRIPAVEATLAEFNRDYDVNNSVYQDLLRRRENARVSMNMDLQRSGGNFRIIYPAILPAVPDGLRLLHFAIVGPFLGFLIPIALVIFHLQLDPRIRHEDQFAEDLGLEILGEIGVLRNHSEARKNRLVIAVLGLALSTVVGVYGYVGWAVLVTGIDV